MDKSKAPSYFEPQEKRAYNAGYKDGVEGKGMRKTRLSGQFPNAYRKGYWNGFDTQSLDA